MYRATPYVAVVAAWPEQVPVPTPQEALSGAKRLYRKFLGRAWTGKWALTSGKRYTRVLNGVYYVNPNSPYYGGWKDIVHFMSHRICRRLYPGAPGHGHTHARLEREMIEYVISQGWLEGKLKRPEEERAVVSLSDVRRDRVLANIERWETKMKRAKTALKKLYRQRKYYESKAA